MMEGVPTFTASKKLVQRGTMQDCRGELVFKALLDCVQETLLRSSPFTGVVKGAKKEVRPKQSWT